MAKQQNTVRRHPAALVAALSDDNRRKIYAAIVLGATSEDQVRFTTKVARRKAAAGIERLIEAGLVSREKRQLIATDVFRSSLQERKEEIPGATEVQMIELRKFIRNGKLVSIPAARTKRLLVLDWLATMFEPARRYSEQQVNSVLGQFNDDVAALRRYLVDEGFLSRDHGEYWRSGGTFEVD